MARKVTKWRHGSPPNWTYTWSENPPTSDSVAVGEVEEDTVHVRQHAKSNAHYWMKGIGFDAPGPAGTVTRVNVLTSPPLTNGVDLIGARLHVSADQTGDSLTEGKVLVGQVGSVIAADSGAKTVTVRAPKGVLVPTIQGGSFDEGYYVSFGVETFDVGSPLAEFMVVLMGAPVDAGDSVNDDVVLTLDTFPGTPPAPGTNVNCAVNFIKDPVELEGGDDIGLGMETLDGANLGAGAVVQVAYNRQGSATTRVRGRLVMLY